MVVRLGTRHLVVLVVALSAIGTMIALGLSYDVDAWYWRDIVGPQLRDDLGFETGNVEVTSGGEQLRLFAMTWVLPGGAFDRAQIRAGDVFVTRHGYPDAEFYSTLERARGSDATLTFRRRTSSEADWRVERVTVTVPAK